MNIGIISNGFGIVYKFRRELIIELLNLNYKVKVISPENEEDKYYLNNLKKMGVDIEIIAMVRRGKNIFQEIKTLIDIYKSINKQKFDKILTYTIKPNIYGGLICSVLKIKYIPTITGLGSSFENKGILKKIAIKLNKLALINAQTIFFQNLDNFNIYKEKKIITNQKIQIVNGSGVNLKKFKGEILKKNEIKIIFIGRIMKEKGIDEYIDAAINIHKDNENVKFFILGQYEEKSYINKIINLEKRKIIKYLGVSTDIRKELKDINCIVNPSWHEGMSNVLLEGGSMKKFLIGSNITGCKEIIINNETGFTFKVKNKEDLKNKIKKFINLSNSDYEKYIEKQYKHIKLNFNRENIIKKYLIEITNN